VLIGIEAVIATIIVLALVRFSVAIRRQRREEALEVGDPYGALYPGREEKRGPRREGNGSRPRKGAGKLGEDGQVGVKLDSLEASDPQRVANSIHS